MTVWFVSCIVSLKLTVLANTLKQINCHKNALKRYGDWAFDFYPIYPPPLLGGPGCGRQFPNVWSRVMV